MLGHGLGPMVDHLWVVSQPMHLSLYKSKDLNQLALITQSRQNHD